MPGCKNYAWRPCLPFETRLTPINDLPIGNQTYSWQSDLPLATRLTPDNQTNHWQPDLLMTIRPTTGNQTYVTRLIVIINLWQWVCNDVLHHHHAEGNVPDEMVLIMMCSITMMQPLTLEGMFLMAWFSLTSSFMKQPLTLEGTRGIFLIARFSFGCESRDLWYQLFIVNIINIIILCSPDDFRFDFLLIVRILINNWFILLS